MMSEINLEIPNNEVPQSKAKYILIGSILLGIIFDNLFYGNIPGISSLIFVVAFYIFFYLYFKKNVTLNLGINNILIIFILLLTATFGIYTNPIFMMLNIMVIPLLIAVHTIIIADKNNYLWYEYKFLNDLTYNVLYGALAHILKPISLVKRLINLKSNTEKYSTFKKVLIGIIISIPLLFIVIGLLSSADEVFKSMIDNLGNIFVDFKINSIVFQLIMILAVSLIIFSYIWNLSIVNNNYKSKITNINNHKRYIIDPVILITILIMICLVYSLFNFIQFTYLFGSLNSKLPSSLTYAEYARRGFWELIAVTLINLSILVININLTEKHQNKINTLIKILNSLLVCFTVIMLFSAHFRMSLYEEVYGYTYLRIFTHSFMLYIFGLLLITLTRIWYSRLSLLKFYLIISLVAYTLINFANVDSIIAKNNIDRYHKTGKLDVNYLTSLSYEAAPQIVQLLSELKNKEVASSVKLENYLYNKKQQLKQWDNWKSYNVSIRKAKKLFGNYDFKYKNITETVDYTE
jgi:hypothetical protein